MSYQDQLEALRTELAHVKDAVNGILQEDVGGEAKLIALALRELGLRLELAIRDQRGS